MRELAYLTGFGNQHETEAEQNALPIGQFSPQQHPQGLFTEQLSSTAFTAPRATNRRSWLYRLRPSATHNLNGNTEIAPSLWRTAPDAESTYEPTPMRWDPPQPGSSQDFVAGLTTMALTGSAIDRVGGALHIYACDQSMQQRILSNADGELLLIPQVGSLHLRTEFGLINIQPGEIAVVPAGVRFAVDLIDGPALGYCCENYGAGFDLPERGPVGANGFANDRDFLYPVAHYEDDTEEHELVTKFAGRLWTSQLTHSPMDVVAWAGNSAPYKYDLARFNAMGSVTYDHPDPSIFTLLTSGPPGAPSLDFIIFPPRWSVAEHTFRPPWYHRNIMSECMGLISGQYEAKAQGFIPGGLSLHNAFTPHGPDAAAYQQGITADLQPSFIDSGLAFMLESRLPYAITAFAAGTDAYQNHYPDCWGDLTAKPRDPSNLG